jgi:beta-lactamase class D
METKITRTDWYPEKSLVVTHISGDVTKDDIATWEKSLHDTLDRLEPNSSFKIFINLHGFKAIDIEAHKRFRAIVPSTLANYGWKVGYVDLFEEEGKKLTFSNTRGIQCSAAVHCHQDATKIELYQQRFSRENEHFFTDPVKALQWVESYQ